jgi:hypothetical protein
MEKVLKGALPMIKYRIIYHIPGRIRIEVPLIKGPSMKVLEGLASIPVPQGIRAIRPNPFTGTLLITYDPGEINIAAYLEDIASNDEIRNAICKGDPREMC